MPSVFGDIEGGIPGLYRMVQPLVAAEFVGILTGALYFMLAIEISAVRTIRSACMSLVASVERLIGPLYL